MKDPDYKKEFERLLGTQDMAAHQKAANRERKVRDAKDATVRTARGVKNFLMGTAVSMTLTAVAIGSALKYTGAGAKIATWGKSSLSSAMSWIKRNRSSVGASGNAMNAFSAFMGGR